MVSIAGRRPRSSPLGASENGVYFAYARRLTSVNTGPSRFVKYGASAFYSSEVNVSAGASLIPYQTAITRVGPPEAPFTFGSPTKTVAPRSGSFARFARFSSPHLLAGRTA